MPGNGNITLQPPSMGRSVSTICKKRPQQDELLSFSEVSVSGELLLFRSEIPEELELSSS
jgi:hypothetical protein